MTQLSEAPAARPRPRRLRRVIARRLYQVRTAADHPQADGYLVWIGEDGGTLTANFH